MSKEELLFRIKNEYSLNKIFSYLDYKYILQVVKINQKLQRKIGIKLEDYTLTYNINKKVKKINCGNTNYCAMIIIFPYNYFIMSIFFFFNTIFKI